MNDDFGVDVDEIIDVVNSSEVFVVMFQLFERRLLVDTRSGGEDSAFIRVVDRARNSEERFRELAKMRPGMSPPERIVAFQWPRTVRLFVESGVWQAIQMRLSRLGVAEATMLAVLSQLQHEEYGEVVKAVRGEEPYRTYRGTALQ